MRKIFTLIIVLILSTQLSMAQANYTEHLIKKGENVYRISLKYGVSVESIYELNPNSKTAIYPGETLRIPKSDNSTTKSDNNETAVIDGNIENYRVKQGDTKFSLAKRFGVSIQTLERQNPHIAKMLQTGQLINLVKTSSQSTNSAKTAGSEVPKTETASGDSAKKYKNYVIEPKETLYSLVKKAEMTIAEFLALNPKLETSVKTGDIIKMPTKLAQTEVKADKPESSPTYSSSVKLTNKNTELYTDLKTDISNGLYIYSPFSADDLKSEVRKKVLLDSNKDFQKYIDFFQGAQIAIDSAKSLNLDFDVTMIKRNIASSVINIDSEHDKNAMLVPFIENSSYSPKVSSNKDISIIDIGSNITPTTDHYVFKSIPTSELEKTKTLNYLSKQNAQVVVVSDLEQARNKDLIIKTIPDAKFLKVDNAGMFESRALKKTLSKSKLNYIILDSDKTIVFLKSTTALMSKLADYNIQLVILESSLLPKKNEVSDMRYRVLKLIFPSTINPMTRKASSSFEKNYETWFESKPSKYAIIGFDVTLDTLLRLAQNSSLENTAKTIVSEHPHIKFDYKKISDFNYSNMGVHLFQYDTNEGFIMLE